MLSTPSAHHNTINGSNSPSSPFISPFSKSSVPSSSAPLPAPVVVSDAALSAPSGQVLFSTLALKDLVFDPSLIPDSIQQQLPAGYRIRPLSRFDNMVRKDSSFLQTLQVLTTVGEISPKDFEERFQYLQKHSDQYYTIVIEDCNPQSAEEHAAVAAGQAAAAALKSKSNAASAAYYAKMAALEGTRNQMEVGSHLPKGRIVGAGTVLVERKFIHQLGLVGHIEDIAVRNDQQGKKLGLRIIETLMQLGKGAGCYKVILDCSEKNVPFYEKCGFERKGVEMGWYVDKPKKAML